MHSDCRVSVCAAANEKHKMWNKNIRKNGRGKDTHWIVIEDCIICSSAPSSIVKQTTLAWFYDLDKFQEFLDRKSFQEKFNLFPRSICSRGFGILGASDKMIVWSWLMRSNSHYQGRLSGCQKTLGCDDRLLYFTDEETINSFIDQRAHHGTRNGEFFELCTC